MAIVKLLSVALGVFFGYALLSGSSIVESTGFSFSKNTSDFLIIIFTLHSSVLVIDGVLNFIKNYLI